MKKYLIAFLILLFASPVWAGDCYVCPNGSGLLLEDGSDWANCADGFDDLAGCSIGADDTIYLRDDDGDYRGETLEVAWSGSDGSPITITADTGKSPVINASVDISGDTWTDQGSNVWRKNVGSVTLTHMIFNGDATSQPGREDATPDADYEWTYSDPNLDIYAESDPNGYYSQIERIGVRTNGIATNGYDWITISGIEVRGARYGIHLEAGSTNVIVDGVTATLNGDVGIVGGEVGGQADDCTIQDSTTQYNGVAGIQVSAGDNWLIRRNTVTRDGLRPASSLGGIKLAGDSGDADITNVVVEYNDISLIGIWPDSEAQSGTSAHGIWLDMSNNGGTEGNANTIRYNWIEDVDKNGIWLEKEWYAEVYGNVVISSDQHGIVVSGSTASSVVKENKIYNNTIYGSTLQGIRVGHGAPCADCVLNNIVRNNISDENGTYELAADSGGGNDGTNGSGNVYTYNNFGTADTDFIWWDANGDGNKDVGDELDLYSDFYTAYAAANGNTVETACMSNPGSDDFTLALTDECRDRGAPLNYQKLLPGSTWPSSVLTGPCGNGCDIGAYEYPMWGIPQ